MPPVRQTPFPTLTGALEGRKNDEPYPRDEEATVPRAKLWMKSKFMIQTVKTASLMLTSHLGGGGSSGGTLHPSPTHGMQGTQDVSQLALVIQSCTDAEAPVH